MTRVLPFSADQVARISVHGADATLEASRSAAGWRVERLRVGGEDRSANTLPPENEVAAVVGDLVQELVGLPEIDHFPLAGQDLASFGLREPRWRLDLAVADGDVWTLQLGGGNVAGTSLYATVEHTREAPVEARARAEILQLGTLILSRLDSAVRRLAATGRPRGEKP